jgi:protein TonB
VLLSVESQAIACLDETDTLAPARARPELAAGPRGGIQEPRKVNDERPEYPKDARRHLRQGLVVVEATISSSGCIRGLRVLRSVHPSLDLEAIRAVSRWRYTPTLLDGRPVPVIMTVTVNFRLR